MTILRGSLYSFSPAVESLVHQWQTLLASVGPILKGEGQETSPGGTEWNASGVVLANNNPYEMSYASFATFRGGLMVNYRE